MWVEEAGEETDDERLEGHDAGDGDGDVDFECGPVGELAGAEGHVLHFDFLGTMKVKDSDQ